MITFNDCLHLHPFVNCSVNGFTISYFGCWKSISTRELPTAPATCITIVTIFQSGHCSFDYNFLHCTTYCRRIFFSIKFSTIVHQLFVVRNCDDLCQSKKKECMEESVLQVRNIQQTEKKLHLHSTIDNWTNHCSS